MLIWFFSERHSAASYSDNTCSSFPQAAIFTCGSVQRRIFAVYRPVAA
jgi:hypothetical protein